MTSCVVCGAAAKSHCSKCKLAHYCGAGHQTAHWASGAHKFSCPELSAEAPLPTAEEGPAKLAEALDNARRTIDAELMGAVAGRRALDTMLEPSPKLRELEELGGGLTPSTAELPPAMADTPALLGHMKALLALLGSPNAAIVTVAARDVCRLIEAVATTGSLEAVKTLVEAVPADVDGSGLPLAAGATSLRTLAAVGAEPRDLDTSFPALVHRFAGTSPLVMAAGAGSVPLVRWLVEQYKADVNRPHPARKWTALQHACNQGGALELVELLLAAGANPTGEPDLSRTSKLVTGVYGYTGTALAHACEARVEENRVAIVKRLLAALPAGAASAKDASDRRPVDFAAAAGNLDVFTALVEAGADPLPALLTFTPPGLEGEVAEGGEGAAALAAGSMRTTYLHLAAAENAVPFLEGAFKILAGLAAAGKGPGGPLGPTGVPLAAVDMRGSDGSTALHRAVTYDQDATAAALIAAGADVTAKTRLGLEFEAVDESVPAEETIELSPLGLALVSGSAKCVELLVKTPGVDVNEVAALPMAAGPRSVPSCVVAFQRREMAAVSAMQARMALEEATIRYRGMINSMKGTPQADAVAKKAAERILALERAFESEFTISAAIDAALGAFLAPEATPSLDLSCRFEGDEGWTVLHWALFNTLKPATVLQVLARGGSAHVTTATTAAALGWPAGTTPLHVAARFGRVDAVKAVQAAGGDLNARDAEGRTPIVVAAASPNLQSMEALLASGGVTAAQLQLPDGKTCLDVFDAALASVKPQLGAAFEKDAPLKRTLESVRGALAGLLSVDADAASSAAAEAARAALEKEEAEAAARKAAKAAAKKGKAGGK